MSPVLWKHEPDGHDYPAAAEYLSLLASTETVTAVVARLQHAEITLRKAKDLLRAARLELLPKDNVHVAGDLHKIEHGHPLSPVLCVRGDLDRDVALQIADGYHRICASYHIDEDTDIPCRLVAFDGSP